MCILYGEDFLPIDIESYIFHTFPTYELSLHDSELIVRIFGSLHSTI
jgi:hypothetical protein